MFIPSPLPLPTNWKRLFVMESMLLRIGFEEEGGREEGRGGRVCLKGDFFVSIDRFWHDVHTIIFFEWEFAINWFCNWISYRESNSFRLELPPDPPRTVHTGCHWRRRSSRLGLDRYPAIYALLSRLGTVLQQQQQYNQTRNRGNK